MSQATVSTLPTNAVEVTETSFEGSEVQQTAITVSGTSKMAPVSATGSNDDRVLMHDDVVTIQLDCKVVGVAFEQDNKGKIVRVQRLKPLEGSAAVIDVIRKRVPRIR